MNSPFEKYPAEYVMLRCTKCGANLLPNRIAFIWPEHDQRNSSWQRESIANKIAQHKCPVGETVLHRAKMLMQTFREIRPNMSFEQECTIYEELLSTQAKDYEINLLSHESEVDKEPGRLTEDDLLQSSVESMPKFAIGRHVINTQNGHVWKIETQTDLDTLVTGYKNGNQLIKIYI